MEEKNIHTYINDLIIDYLSQDITDEKLKELENWINTSAGNKQQFIAMREIWFSASSLPDKEVFDEKKAYLRFVSHQGKKKENTWQKTSLRVLLQSAAAIIILVIVSYISFKHGNEQLKSQFCDIVIEAPWGSKTKTYLPDGTLVWLNTGSKMTYSQGFGVNDRNVHLSGEGYFEVVRNEKLPFNVVTDEMQVNVLGTKFNFCNYPNDEEAMISLLEGRIMVRNYVKKGENIKMNPNQEIFLNKESGHMRIVKVNARNTTEWTKGYLFFDENLLPDIVKRLERSYNVQIIITDPSLKKLRFYSNFTRKELSVKEVLDILSSTRKIKYTINGKEIKLSPP